MLNLLYYSTFSIRKKELYIERVKEIYLRNITLNID